MDASIADRPIDMLLCEELVISLEEKLRDTVSPQVPALHLVDFFEEGV